MKGTRGNLTNGGKDLTGYMNKVVGAREQPKQHVAKGHKLRFNKDRGKSWFTNGLEGEWNSLSSHVVSARAINKAWKITEKGQIY